MKTFKRTVSLALALLMIISVIPLSPAVFGIEDDFDDYLTTPPPEAVPPSQEGNSNALELDISHSSFLIPHSEETFLIPNYAEGEQKGSIQLSAVSDQTDNNHPALRVRVMQMSGGHLIADPP